MGLYISRLNGLRASNNVHSVGTWRPATEISATSIWETKDNEMPRGHWNNATKEESEQTES